VNLRRLLMGIVVSATAVAALLAEPGLRPRPAVANNVWQEVWSNDGFWCEDCCKVGFCCKLDRPCRYPVEPY
jgi:hypothetical protein